MFQFLIGNLATLTDSMQYFFSVRFQFLIDNLATILLWL